MVTPVTYNYATINTIQLPRMTPRHWVSDAKLLPTHTTKKSLHEGYEAEYLKMDYQVVKDKTFKKTMADAGAFYLNYAPSK